MWNTYFTDDVRGWEECGMHYVVGDVHGCLDDLLKLLEKVEQQDRHARFIFVGDWFDRGKRVFDTLIWMRDHITRNGKYQSVRGNHDEDAYNWWKFEYNSWIVRNPDYKKMVPPATQYDLSEVVRRDFQNDSALLESVMRTVEKMPYSKLITIKTGENTSQKFRIVHAWYDKRLKSKSAEMYQTNIWSRQHIFNEGNYDDVYANNEIIVHGHTPTFVHDYYIRSDVNAYRPGMVGYRPNTINVDGGCCFFENSCTNACMLCCICLETLEEFYPYTIEERMLQGAYLSVSQGNNAAFVREIGAAEMARLLSDNYMQKYVMRSEDIYLRAMKDKMFGK